MGLSTVLPEKSNDAGAQHRWKGPDCGSQAREYAMTKLLHRNRVLGAEEEEVCPSHLSKDCSPHVQDARFMQ